jgi:hypothetical protein
MKPQGGRDIEIGVDVVDVVEPPEQRQPVIEQVPLSSASRLASH